MDPLTPSVQAGRILLWSIMNWLSNNVDVMKFILETVTKEALQMSDLKKHHWVKEADTTSRLLRIQELIGVKFVLIIRVNNSITLEISTGELDGINNGIFYSKNWLKIVIFFTQFYIAYIYEKKIEMSFDFNHMDKNIDESQLDEIKTL